MWQSGDGMGWWMVLGPGFVFFCVAALWLFFRYFSRSEGTAPQNGSPLEIAKRRYAAGEISQEQFEDLRRDLQA